MQQPLNHDRQASGGYIHVTKQFRTLITMVMIAVLCSIGSFIWPSVRDAAAMKLAAILEVRTGSRSKLKIEHIDAIVILGGSGARIMAARQLADEFPTVPLILSGPGEWEVDFAGKILPASERIIVDRTPTSTFENGLAVRNFIDSHSREMCIALVTSNLHMRRARAVFDKLEISYRPWVANDKPATLDELRQRVWHEILGLTWYYALGRTDALLPDPDLNIGCKPLTGQVASMSTVAARLRNKAN